jgi:hypothetical protein
MNWSEHRIVVGRLLLLPFAVIPWTIVLVYTSLLRRFHQNIRIRYVSAFLSVCLYFGVVISQMLLFSAITGIQRSTSDDVAFVVLFFENLISIGLLFYRLRNQSNVG